MELEDIHLPVLATTALAILYSDHLGFAYFKGRRQTLDKVLMMRLYYTVWLGLVGMIVSGVALFIPRAEYLLAESVFYIKMAFVLILIFNAWVVGRISHVASERPFSALTKEEQTLLLVSGTLSGMGWVVSAIIGYFFL